MFQHEFLTAIVPWVVEDRDWPRPTHWLNPAWKGVFYGKPLLSYHYWANQKLPNRDDMEVIFGDSGGYSVVTKKAEIDPEEAIRWQIKNTTRGVVLDIPPYRPGSVIQFKGVARQYWDESLERTLGNIERAKPYYDQHVIVREAAEEDGVDHPRFDWWGVIQGESWDQLTEWHERVGEIHPFTGHGEGWALAPKPSTAIFPNVRFLRFAHDHGLKRVHLLQVTSVKTLGVVFALAAMADSFDLISYDSASAVRNAVNRGAVVRDGYSVEYIKQKGREGIVEDLMQECGCLSCQWHREMDPSDFPDEKTWEAEYAHRIALHNHLEMLESFNQLHAAAEDDPERLLRGCSGRWYGAVLREWEKTHTQATNQLKATSLYDFLD